jgi:hypothetical protein
VRNLRQYVEELCDLYMLHTIGRRVKCRRLCWAGNEAKMEEAMYTYRILVRKSLGKHQSKRPRRRYEYNIEMNLREVGWNWLTITSNGKMWH